MLVIRAMKKSDLPLLLEWRNANRNAFFDDREITPEEHEKWYQSRKECDDYMFIIHNGDTTIGCIGIRLLNGAWDIYNVIRGSEFGEGFMGIALRNIINFAERTHDCPVKAKVKRGNRAIDWYLKNGFVIDYEQPDHIGIRFERR